ncbi:hypothetical protein ES705_40710 [subsurface metagenome]
MMISGASEFGKICLKIIRISDAPSAFSASTKSCCFSEKKFERTIRATPPHEMSDKNITTTAYRPPGIFTSSKSTIMKIIRIKPGIEYSNSTALWTISSINPP